MAVLAGEILHMLLREAVGPGVVAHQDRHLLVGGVCEHALETLGESLVAPVHRDAHDRLATGGADRLAGIDLPESHPPIMYGGGDA